MAEIHDSGLWGNLCIVALNEIHKGSLVVCAGHKLSQRVCCPFQWKWWEPYWSDTWWAGVVSQPGRIISQLSHIGGELLLWRIGKQLNVQRSLRQKPELWIFSYCELIGLDVIFFTYSLSCGRSLTPRPQAFPGGPPSPGVALRRHLGLQWEGGDEKVKLCI